MITGGLVILGLGLFLLLLRAVLGPWRLPSEVHSPEDFYGSWEGEDPILFDDEFNPYDGGAWFDD